MAEAIKKKKKKGTDAFEAEEDDDFEDEEDWDDESDFEDENTES